MSSHRNTENPTGAAKKEALRVVFDSRLKLEFQGSKVTSDAVLLAYRELDAALGLTDLGGNLLNDWRTDKNTQHSMVALMRQSIFSRLAVPRELFQTILERIGRLRLANTITRMNADYDKTTATTEAVSSHPVESRLWSQNAVETPPALEKNGWRT